MRAVAGLTDDLKLGIGFWIWRSLYGSWDKAANREGANPSLTCATVKANGAARKAHERDKRAQKPDCVAEVRVLCERVSVSACLSAGTGIFC